MPVCTIAKDVMTWMHQICITNNAYVFTKISSTKRQLNKMKEFKQ